MHIVPIAHKHIFILHFILQYIERSQSFRGKKENKKQQKIKTKVFLLSEVATGYGSMCVCARVFVSINKVRTKYIVQNHEKSDLAIISKCILNGFMDCRYCYYSLAINIIESTIFMASFLCHVTHRLSRHIIPIRNPLLNLVIEYE